MIRRSDFNTGIGGGFTEAYLSRSRLVSSTEAENKMEGGLLLDVVVSKGPAILQLLASEDETLLVRGDALLILDLSLDIFNGVTGLDL